MRWSKRDETIHAGLGRFIAAVSRVHFHHQDVARVESGIDLLQFEQAAQNETGADQKDDRNRHLRRGQDLPATRAGAGAASVAAGGFQRLRNADARGLPRRAANRRAKR